MGSSKYDINARQAIVTENISKEKEVEQVSLEDLYNKTIHCLYHELDALDPKSVEVLTNLLTCVSMAQSQNAMWGMAPSYVPPSEDGQVKTNGTYMGELPLNK